MAQVLYHPGDAAGAVLAAAPGSGLLLGLMLLAAIVGGYAAHVLRVPRLIGFLLAGVALRAILHAEHVPAEEEALAAAAKPLEVLRDLALGIILFALGAVFERTHLRVVWRRALHISLCEIGAVVLAVGVGCGVVAALTQPEYGWAGNLALVSCLALACIETAPAATLYVLREYQARGPNTDTILTLVGLAAVACITLFSLNFVVLAAAGVIETTQAIGQHPWLNLCLTTLGSVGLGVLFGLALSVAHTRLALTDVMLLFFALMIALGAGEKWLLTRIGASYSFLLLALTAGALFVNVALEPQKLQAALDTISAPIFAGFFVMAGYHLHVEELGLIGWLGVTYLVCRCVGKIVGCRLGRRWAGEQQHLSGQLGSALLCQAAIGIGLVAFVQRTWDHALARQFSTIILGGVV
ncbi:MAG TPA: cation:proton antiporter, partial [Phycisphaerae bacterium]|nr:cation:proton antiporter [Phycisphaerae bacterium]HNU46139.1 cation:proton antiporter [Phycisphaerae bacterium]